MPLPDYQALMLPLLRLLADQQVHRTRDTIEALAGSFQLTPEERRQLLPSGKQFTFDNRVGWARTHLKKAGLLDNSQRGFLRITPAGQEVLRQQPSAINTKYLEQFAGWREFSGLSNIAVTPALEVLTQTPNTPEEDLDAVYHQLWSALRSDLLQTIKSCSPAFFECLVVELLVAMGYGGSRLEAGQAIGRNNDEGIDGIIKEDRLGLDIIYIQAKRWELVVGRPEVQKFAGALQGQQARKGIFITTSTFSKEAADYVRKIESKIILIDGQTLAEYMIDNNVGVVVEATYELKRIDRDYFTED
ncbi:restriction endonuclease [Synechococcus elongatus]|uniref:restriction endonuclease n=1 Tax=Synechococcus elongatus TaxID=32046 RepID=UPI000F7E3066|nr:restriction endonuclease [Synechococcus elongatus]